MDRTPEATARRLRQETRELVAQSNQAGLRFLLADTDLALTMLERAERSASDKVRQRIFRHVSKACAVVGAALARLDVSARDRAYLEERLAAVKERLDSARAAPKRG